MTSLVFLLSDFISLENIFEDSALRHMARHHDLIPVVIEDPLEQAIPPIPGLHCTEDPESGRRWMSYWSEKNVQEYDSEMEQRKEGLISVFYGMGLDFLWMDASDEHFIDRLVEYFIKRRRLL